MFTGDIHPVVDPWVLEVIVEATPWWVAFLLVFLTHLGSVYVLVPIVILGYWWDYERMGPWIGAMVGYYGLMAGIKSFNSATRPDIAAPVDPELFPEVFLGWYSHATAISTTSFPSGNVMAPTIVAGLIVLDTRVSTLRRRAIAASLVVLVVAYSRMALSVHYPIDVVGGLLIGLGYLAGITWIRNRVEDETLAMFTLGVGFAAASLWVRNGLTTLPTFSSISGSNRTVAFGAAVGGLIVWYLAHRNGQTPDRLHSTLVPLVAILAAVTAMYVVHDAISHPLVTMAWSGVATAGAVALPWAVPPAERTFSWVPGIESGTGQVAD